MAVQPQTPFKEFIANGVSKEFPLEFDVLIKDHLIVLINDEEASVGSWFLDAENDSIVFNKAPVANSTIKVRRDTPLARTADYQTYNSSFNPPSVNIDFDNIWLKLQEMGVLNWMVENNVKDLNEYVDSLNNETKVIFLEMINKQGLSLNQLDRYVDGLYSKLANVAVDRGWFAEFIVDSSGKNQQEINNNTAYFYHSVAAMIADESLFENAIVATKGYHNIFDEGGATYLISETATEYSITLANGLNAVFRDSFDIRKFGIRNDATLDQTEAIRRMIAYADDRVYEIDFHNFSIMTPKIWTKLATWGLPLGAMGMAFERTHNLKNLKIVHDKTTRLETGMCQILFTPMVDAEFEDWFKLSNVVFDAWNQNFQPFNDNYLGNTDGFRCGFIAIPKQGSVVENWGVQATNYSFDLSEIFFPSPAYSYNICLHNIHAKNISIDNLSGQYVGIYIVYTAQTLLGGRAHGIRRSDYVEEGRLLVGNTIHYEGEYTNRSVAFERVELNDISSIDFVTGLPWSAFVFYGLGDTSIRSIKLSNVTGHSRAQSTNINDIELTDSGEGASFICLNLLSKLRKITFKNWDIAGNQGSYGSAPFLLNTSEVGIIDIRNSSINYPLYMYGATKTCTVDELIITDRSILNDSEIMRVSGIGVGSNLHIHRIEMSNVTNKILTGNLIRANLGTVVLDNFVWVEGVTTDGIIVNIGQETAEVIIKNTLSFKSYTLHNVEIRGKINLTLLNSMFRAKFRATKDVNTVSINTTPFPSEDFSSEIAAGAFVTKTMTVLGAKVGDPVVAAFTQHNANVSISAVVNASDTVLVTFKNNGTATVTISGSINLSI